DEDDTWPMTPATFRASWSSTEATGLLPSINDNALTEFGGDVPFAVVSNECLPLALGAEFQARFTPTPSGTTVDQHGCGDDGRCDGFASFVLSPVREARPGRRLLDALGVVIHASGRVDVTVAGEVEASTDGPTAVPGSTRLELSQEHLVEVLLTPAVNEDPSRTRAVLRVDLRVRRGGNEPNFEWSSLELIDADQLVFDGDGCRDLPGFHLAFEGAGRGTEVGQLGESRPRECINPNQFVSAPQATLTADGADGTASLNFDPPPPMPVGSGEAWADEAIGAPSLLFSGGWNVFVEATNDQPELDPPVRVGYALGHALDSGGTPSGDWNSVVWDDALQIPRVGSQPPSCWDMTCTGSPRSFREPHLFDVDGTLQLAFVAENSSSSALDGLYIQPVPATGSLAADGMPVLHADATECTSLRDPFITPRPDGTASDFWLFFTCVVGTQSRSVQVVPVVNAGAWSVPEGAVPSLLFEATGAFGGGVRSPEIVVDTVIGDVTTTTFRVWFVGISAVGRTSVGLALGTPKGDFPGIAMRAMTPDVPDLSFFEANPILTDEDRSFRGCDGCTIEGFSVVRIDDERLRFLVARRVPLPSGRRFELMPLDQRWRPGG
ncbi:MAG: hypothetical protein AAGE52_29285, partial [Myxococcota bacterium]